MPTLVAKLAWTAGSGFQCWSARPMEFLDLAQAQQKLIVYAFKLNASRLDIGSAESYREADRIMRAELKID